MLRFAQPGNLDYFSNLSGRRHAWFPREPFQNSVMTVLADLPAL
jgi:hypothetical protein